MKLLKGQDGIVSKALKDVEDLGERGIRCIAVIKTDEKDEWKLLGEFGNEQRNVPNDTRTPSL
jgi:hypothetical protein